MNLPQSFWLFAAPLVPICLVVGLLADVFETPRPQREAECRVAIIRACDEGDLAKVGELLVDWQRIYPDRYEPRTAIVIMSAVTMSPARKLTDVRAIAAAASPRRNSHDR